ncbi:unnamed protein product [Pipistrellus nathusii]|uniref:Uncharacterized protein n=1 Tax=Pipistrellus nathusii TaxID=59473 RepID=A0ABN9ZLX4_PIPNA
MPPPPDTCQSFSKGKMGTTASQMTQMFLVVGKLSFFFQSLKLDSCPGLCTSFSLPQVVLYCRLSLLFGADVVCIKKKNKSFNVFKEFCLGNMFICCFQK